MSEEDQTQLVGQLRAKAEECEKFLKTNTDWSHPITETLAVCQKVIYNELADIIETLRNP